MHYGNFYFLCMKIPSVQYFSMLNVKQAIDLEMPKNKNKTYNSVNII